MEAKLDLVLLSAIHADDRSVAKINKLGLPAEATAENVFIRAMKLTGDKLNSYFGKFRTDDLPKIGKLSVGAPVLIGHQKQSRPVGRIFDAHVDDGFVVTAFYVPKGRSDAHDLITDIDLGVAAEASISFSFTTPTCGTCGEDMRDPKCSHWPGDDKGSFYYYDGVERVLEGSIVYRGAHPDTGFVKLSDDPEWQGVFQKEGVVLGGTEQLGRSLARTLNRLIDGRVTDSRSRGDIIRSMASAAGISVSTVEQILDGSINCPPLRRLRGFARVLEVSAETLINSARRDGCSYSVRQTASGELREVSDAVGTA